MEDQVIEPVDIAQTEREAQRRRNQAAIDLLESWDTDDPEEQRETWAFLKQALDEDRLSDRKFFP